VSAWVVPGYEERRQLGQGATGRVVAAIHEGSGTPVAVKYLSPRLYRDTAFLDAFRSEAELLRSLDVPEIVGIYDYVEAPGQGAAIVMELVEGVSLHQMITEQGATTPEGALSVLKGSLAGLAAAHSLGIVHRDYKPENVLVDGDGTSKLADFGVAVRSGKNAPAAGTPLYMAPEQWTGGPASPASDIYAASAVFFECLTAATPFSGRMGELATAHGTGEVPLLQVAEPVQRIIVRGMAKDPRDRPANAMAFIAELDWVAEGAYGPDWEHRGRQQLARRVAALLALVAGAGIAAGAGAAAAASSAGGSGVLGTLLHGLRGGAGGPRFLGPHGGRAVGAATAASIVAVAAIGGTAYVLTAGRPAHSVTASSGTVATDTPGTLAGTSGGDGASPSGPASAPATATPSPTPSATATPSAPPTATMTPTTTAPATAPPPASASPPASTRPPKGPASSAPPSAKPPASSAPPAATVSVALASAPPAGDVVTCGTQPPTFTITGTISSGQAVTVTYQWSGASGGSGTQAIQAGGSITVSNTVAAPSTTWSGTETLSVTTPGGASSSLPLSVTCTSPTG
jgi:serine/threonine-protein kinase